MEQVALTSGIRVRAKAVHSNIKYLINQVYKLLPLREQGQDWQNSLETVIEYFSGMQKLIIGYDDLFFLILCKMEGLFNLTKKEDMKTYRKIIFQCINLLNSLDQHVRSD